MFAELIRLAAWVTTVIAVAINLYIYTYPSLDSANCSWSTSYKDHDGLWWPTREILKIPYFGDLVDTFLLKEQEGRVNGPPDIRILAIGDPQISGKWPWMDNRKLLDIYGNDYYLGHIYKVMKSRLAPTHVAVLGDLFSCDWIEDGEFYNRTLRYSTRLFPRTDVPVPEKESNLLPGNLTFDQYEQWFKQSLESGLFSSDEYCKYEDVVSWNSEDAKGPLFINTTGNHDIGYGGQMKWDNVYRWTRYFGKDNYYIEYGSDTSHPWRLVVVNSLQLDGPLLHPEFQEATWQFVDSLGKTDYNGTTVLVTHVPLYKPDGICTDGTKVEYFTRENSPPQDWDKLGMIKVENHLSLDASSRLLSALFANGKSGIILTGHDHEGCVSYYHAVGDKDGAVEAWGVSRDAPAEGQFVKELTVRSIMGDYDGNTGIVTGHFDGDASEWQFDYSVCPFMVQHVWWAAQVSLLVSLALQALNHLVSSLQNPVVL